MIVATETTRYYNDVRHEIYSQSEDINHFLFMSIRDFRTTEWCKTRNGLVYKKEDPLYLREKPPCHWNCRSEMVPLTDVNPRHEKMINDPSIARRNNKCKPLPPGWNTSS
jgi:uncharacterized protein with gpF-like domain